MVRVRTVYRNAGSGTAHAFHTSSAERAGTPRAAATLVAPVPVRIAYRGVRPFAFPAGRPPAPRARGAGRETVLVHFGSLRAQESQTSRDLLSLRLSPPWFP